MLIGLGFLTVAMVVGYILVHAVESAFWDGDVPDEDAPAPAQHRFTWLHALLQRKVAEARRPDVVIGGTERPYLFRWHVIPRNRLLNVYLHLFVRSDDDRALHDHPWLNCSILLDGQYTEHTIDAGGIHRHDVRQAGGMKFRRSGRFAHRVELTNGPCWTLFITGPRYRQWGFHCPDRGWVHWKDFTNADDFGAVGKGCNQ